MKIKTQIIEKCKTERSRNVMLSQLALIERGVKENGVLKKVNGDEDLALRTQLHWELHDLNSGGNKTYSVEHIAGLVGLILLTRAWDGYLTGTGVASSQSFKAFMADNGLDLEHVQYCLDKCARELMEDFARACTMSHEEVLVKANTPAHTRESVGRDIKQPGGRQRELVRMFANKAKASERARKAYEAYVANEISLNNALVQAGLRESQTVKAAKAAICKFAPSAKALIGQESIDHTHFVQFALNYVVDQFKDGIPPELLAKYVSESPAK